MSVASPDVYQPEVLTGAHAIENFTCGVDSMDKWLHRSARAGQRAGLSQTHVWSESASGAVLAYFAITPTSIQSEHLSSRERGGSSGDLPGYLVAKLALHVDLRGASNGSILLVDALRTIVSAADAVGGRLIVVDALDDKAHAFYERADFRALSRSNRLVMRVSTARAALGP